MSIRKPIKTTIKEAIDYWHEHMAWCDFNNVDWLEASTHCWRCGCEKNLERCHIVPDALGGKDEPSNIVLLCKRCHAEGPNVADSEIMWDWIHAYAVPFYETLWMFRGMKEYEFIYRKNIKSELKAILDAAEITDEVDELMEVSLQSAMEEASTHFGQPYFNVATVAGCYRMMLKKFAKSLGVCFPIEDSCKNTSNPWWSEFYP